MNGYKNWKTDCRDSSSPLDPCIGCPLYKPEDEEKESYNPWEDKI